MISAYIINIIHKSSQNSSFLNCASHPYVEIVNGSFSVAFPIHLGLPKKELGASGELPPKSDANSGVTLSHQKWRRL